MGVPAKIGDNIILGGRLRMSFAKMRDKLGLSCVKLSSCGVAKPAMITYFLASYASLLHS